jgi:hypothetical protein
MKKVILKDGLKGKLSLGKETMSKFDMDKVNGGGFTKNYSECGTGPATIICCATVQKACDTDYKVCGTGTQSLVIAC